MKNIPFPEKIYVVINEKMQLDFSHNYIKVFDVSGENRMQISKFELLKFCIVNHVRPCIIDADTIYGQGGKIYPLNDEGFPILNKKKFHVHIYEYLLGFKKL